MTKPLRNSGTQSLRRSTSMEVVQSSAPAPAPAQPQPRKSYTFHFPTSPEFATGEELLDVNHHPKHPIVRRNSPDLFTCDGCKEYGAGISFACSECDFQLHEFCALSPAALKNHPLHAQHQLLFHSKSKQGNILWPKCDICGKATKGSTFRCSACSFQMHPCCAMLSTEMNFIAAHPHPLKLLPSGAPTTNGEADFMCGECKRKRSGRLFRCTDCDYHLHAVCAKAMINGLQSNGIKPTEKPSMLGDAARMASIVVIKFIGGLMEGIGEGVGGAIVQGITMGRGVGRRRTN